MGNMTYIINNLKELQNLLLAEVSPGETLGFVPTMGALHEGHLAIIRKAKQENSAVVVSIYVNDRQFNNKEDYISYPRKNEEDIALLSAMEVDVIYFPKKEELFNPNFSLPFVDLMGLDQRLEGASRPGHFQGVMEVVYALFQHVKPHKAYFGLKDFQQVAVIRKLIESTNLPIELVKQATVRTAEGLAMSSRNFRLNPQQKAAALVLVHTLTFLKDNYGKLPLLDLLEEGRERITKSTLTLDYLEIVDYDNLSVLSSEAPKALACVAAFCGEVRLIYNMLLQTP